jgi:hypothetical protein
MRSVHSLLAAAVTVLTCCCVGRVLLAQLRLTLTRLECWTLSLLAGSAVVSVCMLGLGLAGGLHPLSFAMLSTTAATLCWRTAPEEWEAATPVARAWRWTFFVLFAAYGPVYATVALAPEISPDGLTYHLPLVQRYLRDGAIRAIPTDLYAQLSQGLEMLFLPAYAFGRHSAAALVHLSFLFALPLLMLAYGRRQGSVIPAAAAGLLVLLSPVAGADGSAAYNDVALAAVVFGTFFTLERWRVSAEPDWLMVAGLLAGFAFGIKYTAVFVFPFALAAIIWRGSSVRAKSVHAARFVVPALLMILPWLLKNYAFTGNPVAPFFNDWFPNNIMDWPLENEYLRAVRNYRGYTNAWSIPWETTVLGGTLQGLLGPAFLLAPAGLLVLRHAEGRRLILAAVAMLLPFAVNHGTRFLIPALPFLALALTRTVGRWPMALAAVVAFHAFASWPTVIPWYAAPHAWRIREIPWAAAFGGEAQTDFLRRHLPEYPLVEALNAFALPGEGVLAFRTYAASYLGADLWIDNHSRATAELCRLLYLPVLEGRQPTAGERFWFPKAALTGIRLQKPPGSVLAADEIRLFDLMEPLPTPAGTVVTALPPHDDAALGFDGNRLTRWRGGLSPDAAHLELTWRSPLALTRVDVEHRPIHPSPAVTLYGRQPDGAWRLLNGQAERIVVAPIPSVRAAASRELLRRGVQYILLHDQDLIASDVRDHLPAWNWRVLRTNRGLTLYQVQRGETTIKTALTGR